MKMHSFNDLFLALLSDIYYVENQFVTDLPKVIAKAQSEELKEALTVHLNETKTQISRLERIFTLLDEKPVEADWLNNTVAFSSRIDRFLDMNIASPLLDAAIIVMVQRVEHFELATYGTLLEYANIVDQDEISDILKESLKEATKTDSALTKLAKGGVFSKGINVEALRHL